MKDCKQMVACIKNTIEDVNAALELVKTITVPGDVSLNERGAHGLYVVLQACQDSLDKLAKG